MMTVRPRPAEAEDPSLARRLQPASPPAGAKLPGPGVGGVGVFIAALVALTVREPTRENAPANRSLPKGNFKSLLGNNVIRNIMIGGTLFGVSSGCLGSWGPAYVMRTFHLTATETGATYGAVSGLLALVGILLGGIIASQLTKRGAHFALGALAMAMLMATLTQFATLGVNNYTAFLVLTALTVLLSAFYIAPTHATIQSSVDPSARSFASAVALFCINGIGIALGAFAAGAMSDLLRPIVGDNSLRVALAIATVFKLGAAFFYWRASRHLKVLGEAEVAK